MLAMSISEARKRLFELRDRIVSDHEEIVLTHRDGNVVMISLDEWEAYQETERLLRDRAALRAVLDSFTANEHGNKVGKTVDEVFQDLS
jgi:prevent-host-death family protein